MKIKSILFIEKQQKQLEHFNSALNKISDNFFVIHAETPDKAIKTVQQIRPDIVFMASDISKKCFELLRELRIKDGCVGIPIYIYTKLLHPRLGLQSLMEGAAGCILKSDNIEHLTTTLYQVLATEDSRAPMVRH